jgi:hypothetical protein
MRRQRIDRLIEKLRAAQVGIALHQENKFFELDLPGVVSYTLVQIEVFALINLQLNLLLLRYPNQTSLADAT